MEAVLHQGGREEEWRRVDSWWGWKTPEGSVISSTWCGWPVCIVGWWLICKGRILDLIRLLFFSFSFIVMMSCRSSWVLTYLADEFLFVSLQLLSTSVSRAPFLAITSFYSSWLTLHTLPSVTLTSSPLLTS